MNCRMRLLVPFLLCCFLSAESLMAQDKSLVNTSGSAYARLNGLDMDAVVWTNGFWADRFQVCQESMVPHIWQIYNDPEVSHAFRNFEIAAGLAEGEHSGPSFHDGDFYKVLEALASSYAITKDPKLDQEMDRAIAVIAKAQEDDGYLYTPAIIEKRKNKGTGSAFQDRVNFEAYNLGHLMTAASIHHRATGKTSLLEVAKKAGDFLCNYYEKASPELARNAICPSHYMGLVELYRTTKEPKYIELAKNLINIRGTTDDGTDDNQDRIPFRKQTKVMGHAVRANYLFAGVADVYAETGDISLLSTLDLMWNDVVSSKMYITGGCGSLYDGVSPDGTSYNPKEVQKIHQAYGRDYQLPNHTAHNETCANIGNVLWNWRMLQLSGEAKYADVMELALYNSVLSGVSLDGKGFLYTNPLAVSEELPYQQRWSKVRVPYISLSNCCPPNAVRTVSQVSNYAYNSSEEGLWFNLYGSNQLTTNLPGKGQVKLSQETNYPWDGHIKIKLEEVPENSFSMFLRIPGWSKGARLQVNGEDAGQNLVSGEYTRLNRKWSAGDEIELILPMEAKLMESHPLVEETRNQVAVKRGPVVYCLESTDLPEGLEMFNIAIPAGISFTPEMITVDNAELASLKGEARLIRQPSSWGEQLYREAAELDADKVQLRLVPYYAWGNRGKSEMTVWMPVSR